MSRQIGLGKILIGVVVISIVGVAGLIGARMIIAPSFTAVNNDYRYQWHRVANEQEWKDFKVKYQGNAYCKDCHSDQAGKVAASVHAKVQCENCHGPAVEHPDKLPKLVVDKGRNSCLRCHASLPYRPVVYAELPKGTIQLKMINPDEHNSEVQCADCHDPHKAELK
jgi:predicted CXXCH cytochrome family protein